MNLALFFSLSCGGVVTLCVCVCVCVYVYVCVCVCVCCILSCDCVKEVGGTHKKIKPPLTAKETKFRIHNG